MNEINLNKERFTSSSDKFDFSFKLFAASVWTDISSEFLENRGLKKITKLQYSAELVRETQLCEFDKTTVPHKLTTINPYNCFASTSV